MVVKRREACLRISFMILSREKVPIIFLNFLCLFTSLCARKVEQHSLLCKKVSCFQGYSRPNRSLKPRSAQQRVLFYFSRT